MTDALVRALHAAALKGNARALSLALNLHMQADRQKALQNEHRAAFARDYKARAYREIAEARDKGLPPPLALLPHPDDIVFDRAEGYRIVGPADKIELQALEETLHVRDTLILQDALDQRLHKGADRQEEAGPLETALLDGPGSGLLLALFINSSVPQRLHLSDVEIVLRQDRYLASPKRALLKAVYGAWSALGIRVPRGQVFPRTRDVRDRLMLMVDMLAALKQGRFDLDAIARGDFDEAAEEFFEDHGMRSAHGGY